MKVEKLSPLTFVDLCNFNEKVQNQRSGLWSHCFKKKNFVKTLVNKRIDIYMLNICFKYGTCIHFKMGDQTTTQDGQQRVTGYQAILLSEDASQPLCEQI